MYVFRNPDKGLLPSREQELLTLAWIVTKDSHLFAGDVMAFVTNYLAPDTQGWLKRSSVRISYFYHDWTLNDLTQTE